MSLFTTLISGKGLLDFGSQPVLENDLFLMAIKVMFIIGGSLYALFALLVVKQISLMSKTIMTPFSIYITLIGYLHLLAALVVLIYFFTVL